MDFTAFKNLLVSIRIRIWSRLTENTY